MAQALRRILIPLAGGVLGYFAETVHRRAGVWTLPNDGPMPLWVALVYALGIAFLSEGFRLFERRQPPLKVTRGRAAIEALLLIAMFLLPPLLYRHEWLLTALTSAYVFARLVRSSDPGDATVLAAVVIADYLLERALVDAGLYRYSVTTLAMPLWLGCVWGAMALSLRRIFRYLHLR